MLQKSKRNALKEKVLTTNPTVKLKPDNKNFKHSPAQILPKLLPSTDIKKCEYYAHYNYNI